MIKRTLPTIAAIGITLTLAVGAERDVPPGSAPPHFKSYNTNYYLLKTDVPEDVARETALRIDKMFEEYSARTSAFSRAPRERQPLILFSKKTDYIAMGGKKDSGGYFRAFLSGGKLVGDLRVVARSDGGTWSVVQHEGFHQFAFTAIAANLPVWVNEGLAEFFGEGLYTGDNFVTGLVPESRRLRIVDMINEKQFTPLDKFTMIDDEAWGKKLTLENYDQAWSMVHFLALGDDGKYQKAFIAYMQAVSKGTNPEKAWQQQFGANDQSFETAWKKYWLNLPKRPTMKLFAQARAMTMTSYLARAAISGKKYTAMQDFIKDAAAGEIKLGKDQLTWLPPGLIKEWVDEETDAAEFKVTWSGNVPTLVDQFGDTMITVEYKNNKTIATVKEKDTAKDKPK